MNDQPNQVILRRIVTDVAVFSDRPSPDEIAHLKLTGFRYDKGQWSRTHLASGIHPAAVVFEYTAASEA